MGEGYDWNRVAGALSHPPRVGVLPPLPFGWRGSGLAVAEELLGRLVANLLDSLRDDGFSRMYAVCPPGLTARAARRRSKMGSYGWPQLLPRRSNTWRRFKSSIGDVRLVERRALACRGVGDRKMSKVVTARNDHNRHCLTFLAIHRPGVEYSQIQAGFFIFNSRNLPSLPSCSF